jgi:ABC-2 type transport system ATP-binding protein
MLPLIELDNIVKHYESMQALSGVSLKIHQGITGLLGPNGAGKSTLIKVILGLVRVTSGSGQVLGFKLGRDGRKIRDKIGYMPEDDCYIAGMSGIEVVRFAACLTGMPYTEGLRRSHEILDFCGMGQERYRDIETFSTGMRQKVKFAQAIVHDPPLLIFDEPTSGLDPEEREAMLSRVRVLARDFGKTVILSTHILPDVQSVCDNVVVMAGGRLRLAERLEVLNRPSSPTVQIEVNHSAEKFSGILNEHQLQATFLGRNVFSLLAEDNIVPDSVWQLAREHRITIVTLRPALNSLEDIFVNCVKESQIANS